MALRKAIETPHGVMAEYWRIVEVTQNHLQSQTQAMMYRYLDEAKRRAGKQHLAGLNVVLDGEDFMPDAGRAALYAKLKSQPHFLDADDALDGDASYQPGEA